MERKGFLSFWLATVFLFPLVSDQNSEEWKKIVPLQTTRVQVEATLGPAGAGFDVTYHLQDGNLSIEYSTGPCESGQKEGWNVPKDVVVSLHFSPRKSRKLSQLRLDSRKFRKITNEHLPSVTYYINDEDGITYAIQQGKVDYIEYGPSRKFDHLALRTSCWTTGSLIGTSYRHE